MGGAQNRSSKNFYLSPLLAGALAGVSVDITLYPLDTLKTRLQSQQGFYKAGGFRGVYQGLLTVATASMPTTALFFACYEVTKNACTPMVSSQYVPLVHMFAASVGEMCACVVRVPAEVAKQRKQTYVGMDKCSSVAILVKWLGDEAVLFGVLPPSGETKMYSIYLAVAFLLVPPGYTHVLEEDGIVWPREYHFKGEITFLSVGLVEPFEIWYSVENNKSRIDYYDGTVKRYYVGETEGGAGEEYKIYPTSDGLATSVVCDREPRDRELYNFLTDASNFTYQETITYNGRAVEVWESIEIELDKEKEQNVLYVYRHEDVHIPIRNERKKYNLWTGGLQTHMITTYFEYSKPTADDVNVKLVVECEDYTDPEGDMRALHPMIPSDVDTLLHGYKEHHNRHYKTEEHTVRRSILERNWQRMIHHNKQNLGYKLTLNKFSDRTEEELASLTGTRPSHGTGTLEFPHTYEEVERMVLDLPDNYDMRIEGTISTVKNQGQCGSCWTFSTTAAVEGALARNNGGRDLDLSEQSIVDCAWGYYNHGCDGGMIDTAFKYILAYGIPTQLEYGDYLNEDGSCHIDNVTEVYNIHGFVQVPSKSVNAMKVALYEYGPVSVAINANEAVMGYSSGIFFDPTCNESHINHAVTVVGYGVRDGALYWIVKNSWGEDWGQDGYLLISATDNNCHILEYAYYPVV